MTYTRFFPHCTITKPRPAWIFLLLFVMAMLLRLFFMWTSLVHLPVTSDEASLALLAKMIARGEFTLLFIGQPYQFPVESYMMAPLVEWLPRNALGVRYQPFMLGLLSVFGFLAILRTALPPGSRWPAMLLVLFPSAYLLMLTSAYAPPQYSMSITLAWLSIYAVLRSRQSAKSSLLVVIAGFSCGLAVSNHLLTLTISAGVVALVVCCGSAGRAIRDAVIFGVGFSIGALPLILVLCNVSGAYENLPGSTQVSQALGRMIDPAITETLAGAMGINPVLFPDFREHLAWPHILRTVFAVAYILLFSALLAERGVKFFLTTAGGKWPNLELVDMALIASILTLGLFAFHQTSWDSYRYLLPAVWCFPFLIGHAYRMFKGEFRTLIGVAAVLLALFNVVVSGKVISEWRKPGQIERYADTPQIETLLEALDEKAITRCYASFWLAYRITFATDERIICAPPYNERFLHWPIPYKKQVDQSPDAVYILTQTFGSRLTAPAFQQHLKNHGVTAELFKVFPFWVFSGFEYHPAAGFEDSVLTPDEYTLSTNAGGEEFLAALQDGNFNTAWRSQRRQEKGQWVEVGFAAAKTVSGVTLFHLPKEFWSPDTFTIAGYEVVGGHGRWRLLAGPLPSSMERMRFVNNHPVYLGFSQQIRFEPVRLEALRVEIVKPQEQKKWGLSELEISVIDNTSGK